MSDRSGFEAPTSENEKMHTTESSAIVWSGSYEYESELSLGRYIMITVAIIDEGNVLVRYARLYARIPRGSWYVDHRLEQENGYICAKIIYRYNE